MNEAWLFAFASDQGWDKFHLDIERPTDAYLKVGRRACDGNLVSFPLVIIASQVDRSRLCERCWDLNDNDEDND